MAKGSLAPSELVAMFERRKAVEREVLSSHGEASRYFVTFLDNHDQHSRIFYSPSDAPLRFADQATLGIALLFTLQGIPCLYYGTEQGLHGARRRGRGGARGAVGQARSPSTASIRSSVPIETLSAIRQAEGALRYGRQYFRPLSGDGVHFGISGFRGGVLAFSRILNDEEVVVVANASTQDSWSGEVIVDLSLNPAGAVLDVLFSNKSFGTELQPGSGRPSTVVAKASGGVEIREVSGTVTRGPAKAVKVSLAPMEVQILRRDER